MPHTATPSSATSSSSGAPCGRRSDSFTAALQRDPTDTDVHFYLGISLNCAGQIDEAAAVIGRLAADDPLSPLAGQLAAAVSWFQGRPAEGLDPVLRSLEMDPESLMLHWTVGYQYALLGRSADTAERAAFMRQRAPSMPYTIQLGALVAVLEGRKAEALQMIAGVNTDALDGHTRFHIGEVFAMAGDSARAMQLVDQAVNGNFYPHLFIARYSPFLEPLRGSAEFARIVAKAERRVKEFRA